MGKVRHVAKLVQEGVDNSDVVRAEAAEKGPTRHEVEEDPIKAGILYLMRVRRRELESCLETIRHRHGYEVELVEKIKDLEERMRKIEGGTGE